MNTLIIIAVGVVAAVFLSLLFLRLLNKPTSPPNSIDSLNPPVAFSPEMRKYICDIANYFGIRYVTQSDVRKFTVNKIGEQFSSMPGWDVWDISIHEAQGQYERMERAATDSDIKVLSYDPKYQLAKVQGKSAVYLTGCKRCSCPDYRKRHLPCKHMYALAMELDGDVDKCILDDKHPPLYGLTLALAGHLPKSNKGVGGIRAEITNRGGIWVEHIEVDVSAVVMGVDPSVTRVSRAEGFDMEILSPLSINDMFSAK